MDIEQLRAFIQVARDGSFSRAARTLDVSQPSISARIAALERELGGRLIARGARSVALTELGESFLPYVDRALATLHEGVETVRQTEAAQHAAALQGRTLTSFLAASVRQAAAQTIREHEVITLSARDSRAVMRCDGSPAQSRTRRPLASSSGGTL